MDEIAISALSIGFLILILLLFIPLWLFVKAWNRLNRYFVAFIIFFSFLPGIYLLFRLVSCSLLSLCTLNAGEGIEIMFLPITLFLGCMITLVGLLFFGKKPTNVLPNSSIPAKGGRRV